MKRTQDIYSFVFAKSLAFHFCNDPDLPDLLKKLHLSSANEPAENSICIKCSHAGRELKSCKWNFYKGIPWKAAVKYNDSGEISKILFHAIFFKQFLFFRIVLLPLLWRLSSAKGGFYTLGSVFRNSERTILLFARPGAGKTRYTLKKLLDPAYSLISDGSLLYLPEYGFIPVIDEIELRWKTINGLPYWKKLPILARVKLFFLHLISVITRRFISFNLPLSADSIGIIPEKDFVDTPHEVSEIANGEIRKLSAIEVDQLIVAYLDDYHHHYKNIFNDDPPLRKTAENIFDFCKKYNI